MRLPAPRTRKIAASFVVALIVLICISAHSVPTSVSAEDARYANLVLAEAGYDATRLRASELADFDAEVKAILSVQNAVLAVAPKNQGIPFRSERELKDLFERGYGLCYDRSRAIEKVLAWLGFRARHVAIYSTAVMSRLQALLSPQVASHAVTEVMTRKGWMVVDSNARWVGLDENRMPVSIIDIQRNHAITWSRENKDSIDKIFKGPFIAIRGLYSRHGYFYPPYTPVPDFNFLEIWSNLYDT